MEYLKEDLQKLWGRKDKVIFPSYETVTAVALEKLFDKLPQKFFKKVDNAPQKSKYRKKTRSDPKIDVSLEATHLNYQSKDNDRSEVLSQYVQKKWNRKIDWVSVSNEIATDYGISCNFREIGLDITTDKFSNQLQ